MTCRPRRFIQRTETMLVYVIRHGQSESNLGHYFPGKEGVHLTEKGIEDAKGAGRILSSVHFTHIYASDFLRAVETAQNAIPGCSPILDQRLRECDYGCLAGLDVSFVREHYGNAFIENQAKRDYTPYGGESTPQQIKRVTAFVKELELLKEDSTVAVFCHEGTVKSFLCAALEQELNFRRIRSDNGSVAVFEFKDGKWTLIKWNITEN